MYKLPPEIIDQIAVYTNIEEAQYLTKFLSKRTILHFNQKYKNKIKKWIYTSNIPYLNVVAKHIEIDSYENHIPIKVIELLVDKIDWSKLLWFQYFSSNFLKRHINRFTPDQWRLITNYQVLTEKFIIEYAHFIDFKNLVYCKLPSYNFIERYKHKINWNLISEIENIPQKFIINYEKFLNIPLLTYSSTVPQQILKCNINTILSHGVSLSKQPLTEDFLHKYGKKLISSNEENKVINAINLSNKFLENYVNIIGWENLSKCTNLSQSFMRKHKDSLCWWNICLFQNLTDNFIEDHKYKLFEYEPLNMSHLLWKWVLAKPSISDKYKIKTYKELNSSGCLLLSRTAPESYLTKYENLINWSHIYHYNKLSENLINSHISENFPFKKNVDFWRLISKYQTRSESFIEMHKNKLNWYLIDRYQTHLSKSFRDQYRKEYCLDY
jgi:hypothetical protein